MRNETKRLISELTVLKRRTFDGCGCQWCKPISFQRRGTEDPVSIPIVNLQEVAGVLQNVSFRDFFLKLGHCRIFLLRFQEISEVLDLGGQCIVGNAIQALPKDKPHADAKTELGSRKDYQIPQGKPKADGESSHDW
ncbi:MAG: hypothetical protein ABR920_13965 [Terriglobales bacterium]